MDLRLVYSEQEISDQVQRLAAEISSDYAGQELVLIVVLKGAFMFAADLARRIRVPLALDFVKLKSYQGSASTGEVLLLEDTGLPLAARNVLVVEDIVDTGLSLAFLLEHLAGREPKSLKVCAMFDKRGDRRCRVAPDYAGIICDRGFLVGYGLDLDERYRELPAVYEVVNSSSGGGLNDSPV